MRRNLITSLLLGILSPFCFAFDSYQIEMIVFSNINAESFNTEQWPSIGKNNFNLANSLTPQAPNKFVLTEEDKRIAQHYKILLHAAWKASFAELSKQTSIHLYGGKLYDNAGNVIETITNESTAYSPNQNWQLDGKVSVRLDRYFDLKFNLLLAIPADQITKLNTGTKRYNSQPFTYIRLAENRRSRSQELNYIDHPLYGVVFKIVPAP